VPMCVVSPFRLSVVADRWSGGGARGAKRLSAGVPAVEPGERRRPERRQPRP